MKTPKPTLPPACPCCGDLKVAFDIHDGKKPRCTGRQWSCDTKVEDGQVTQSAKCQGSELKVLRAFTAKVLEETHGNYLKATLDNIRLFSKECGLSETYWLNEHDEYYRLTELGQALVKKS